jgi:hypothetical protein
VHIRAVAGRPCGNKAKTMMEKVSGKERASDAAIALGVVAFLALGMAVGAAWLVGRTFGWLP